MRDASEGDYDDSVVTTEQPVVATDPSAGSSVVQFFFRSELHAIKEKHVQHDH